MDYSSFYSSNYLWHCIRHYGDRFLQILKAVIGLYFLPLFYLMMINMVDTREKVRWILRIIIFAVALQAVIGMIEFILGIQLFLIPL